MSMAQFVDGSREQPKKMKEKVDLLSADDVTALVNYYGSVQ
jgi:cytochrome c553